MAYANWEFIGTQLLERERRPVVVVDLAGRVIRANRAFLFLLPDGSRTQGVSLRDEWLHADSQPAFDAALRAVLRSERTQVTVTLTKTLFPLDLVLELVRLGSGESPMIMAVMVDAVSRGPALPLRPVVGITYEVTMGEDGRRRVVRAVSSGDEAPATGHGDAPCWRTIFRRDTECPACPVRALGTRPRAAVVTPSADGLHGHQTLLVAEPRSEAGAAVTAIPIDADTYSAVVAARFESLAAAAQLSPREREVLSLLAMGRSLEQIATVTGITERTAKFHQQNVLRKLGADSRVDLLRLIL